MFAVGEKVVHNEFGICLVGNIKTSRLPGEQPREFYELTPLTDDGHGTILYVPVEHNGCLREPLSRDQILMMIDAMLEISPMKYEPETNRTQDIENTRTVYRQLMNSGDFRDWVILLKTIYQKGKLLSAQRKRLNEYDSLARDIGERLLYGEIAGVMDIPVSQVEQFITRRIEHNH